MKKVIFVLMGLVFINMLSSVSALSVSVHVPEKYTSVVAGERFYFEIDIKYPENPSRKDLRLEYEILTEDGDLISQAKTLKAIETQASFIDFIVIPESAKGGLHFINVNVRDYEKLSEEVGSSFHVRGAGIDDLKLYFMLIFGAIVLVGVLVILSILLRKR